MNGPCGGQDKGKCEVDKTRDCAWILIYNELKKRGRLDLLREIKNAPLITITMFVQVAAVTLLPSALLFLVLLLNDKSFMGDYVNTKWQNVANWSIIIFVVIVSTMFAVTTLFPDIWGQ